MTTKRSYDRASIKTVYFLICRLTEQKERAICKVNSNSHGLEMEYPWRLRIKTTQIALSLKAEQISQIE